LFSFLLLINVSSSNTAKMTHLSNNVYLRFQLQRPATTCPHFCQGSHYFSGS
jgi:hypothetical protein